MAIWVKPSSRCFHASKSFDTAAVAQTGQGCPQSCVRELAQRTAGRAARDEEESVAALKVARTDADDGFHDHVA